LTTTLPCSARKARLLVAGDALGGHAQPRLDHRAARHSLVVAAAHGDGGGQVRQALPAVDRPAAEGEAEDRRLGVQHLDRDAAPARLVDDDHGIGVELLIRRRAGEQALVDGVAGLQREDRHALEAELLVQRDGVRVVVHDGKVHEGPPAREEMLGERAHQGLADARAHRLRVDGEAPQRRAVLGIVEGMGMVDAGDGADHLPRPLVLRDVVGEHAAVPVLAHEGRIDRHHAPRGVDPVHGERVGAGAQAPHDEALGPAAARPVCRQPEPVGVGRVEEQLLRGVGQDHMRIAQVQRDVPPALGLAAQRLGEVGKLPEGMREEEPSPAAVDRHVLRQFPFAGDGPPLHPVPERRCRAPLEAVVAA
jgi:hypothetical protein